MIVKIESTIPSFKTVTFHAGLNILLADRLADSTDRQTRNSAGKTSLLEIIHFLLGADCDDKSLFRSQALIDHRFIGSFVIAGKAITVSRTGADPSKIWVLGNSAAHSELAIKTDKASGKPFVSNGSWRLHLGHAMFGLPADPRGTPFEESYTPTFRALFSYFVRRWTSKAFLQPEKQAEKQQRWDWQVNLSYLLGLDWRIPFDLQRIRGRERSLQELKKAAKGGAFGDVLGTVAELRPQVTVAETKAARLRDQLAHFEVLDSYRDLSQRAARAKAEMQALGREAISLLENLQHIERAFEAEKAPHAAELQRVYAAAGIELPGIALRRWEEVSRFHDSVIGNRRMHLEQEIAQLKGKLADGEQRLAVLDGERSQILQVLEGRGALEDFVSLQHELAAVEASAAALRERFKAAEILEGESTQLDIDRSNVKRRLQEDHQQRKAALDDVILIVAECIGELYDDRAGRFVVEATDNGPEFRISIDGDRGGGISNMEIFCFDLALLGVVTKRYGGPGFLVHDSHLFDGVDERQIAKALLLASNKVAGSNLQYIATMNSDIFDRLPLPKGIEREKVVLETRLSDATDSGGLFGFRFE